MLKAQLGVPGALAEFAGSRIRERERQRVGIAIAKKKGVCKGCKKSLSVEQTKAFAAMDGANGGNCGAALAVSCVE